MDPPDKLINCPMIRSGVAATPPNVYIPKKYEYYEAVSLRHQGSKVNHSPSYVFDIFTIRC